MYQNEGYYEFEILKEQIFPDGGMVAVVRDVFSNEINVNLSANSVKNIIDKKVKLRVKYVRKGIPVVFDPELSGELQFEEKKEYVFTVEGLLELKDGAKFYIFKDSHGTKHFIFAGWYKGYEITIKKQILCEVVKITGGGRLVIEPVHPLYRRNRIYRFSFVSEEEVLTSKGEFRHVVVIANFKEDKFYILKKHFKDKKCPGLLHAEWKITGREKCFLNRLIFIRNFRK